MRQKGFFFRYELYCLSGLQIFHPFSIGNDNHGFFGAFPMLDRDMRKKIQIEDTRIKLKKLYPAIVKINETL
jgi:hypothetical protein